MTFVCWISNMNNIIVLHSDYTDFRYNYIWISTTTNLTFDSFFFRHAHSLNNLFSFLFCCIFLMLYALKIFITWLNHICYLYENVFKFVLSMSHDLSFQLRRISVLLCSWHTWIIYKLRKWCIEQLRLLGERLALDARSDSLVCG